jgi:preprotein translocase subunit SecE
VSDESEAGEGRQVPAADAPGDAVDGVNTADNGSADAEIDADQVSLAKAGGDDNAVAETASDGSDRESALVGAASAGSARAAARRSGVRAGATPTKGVATKPRDAGREVRLNYFARLRRFLREVVAELRKVIWPARNQMVTYTIVVIVFVVFMVALTAGLDVLFAKAVLAVFG